MSKANDSKRGNRTGHLFQRAPGSPWVARYYEWNGTRAVRRERSTYTRNRADAERVLRGWLDKDALARQGLAAPIGGTALHRHASATIESHLTAFSDAMRAAGRTERHTDETAQLIRATAEGCGWTALGQIDAEGLERYIAFRRAPTPAKEGAKPPRKWAPRTAQKCCKALGHFTRWCVSDGRLALDPLVRVKKPAPTRQRERRYLQPDEWAWLRMATGNGPERFGMDAQARRLLYETAIQTGLRSTEIRSLRRTSLVLDGKRPHILLAAGDAKSRRAAQQYIKPGLAAELRQHLKHTLPGVPVFATMPRREHVAAMLRADLAAAREAWLADAGDDAEARIEREGSDFLRATNHDGKRLDFHSLRHSAGVWAAMGGASPKALQTLMRHRSIQLTLDVYGHLLPTEAAETVHRMPEVKPVVLRMTGTDCSGFAPPPTPPPTGTGRDAQSRGGTRNEEPRTCPQSVQERGFQTRRTGLEPATTGSTVRYSNQLSYRPGALVARRFSTAAREKYAATPACQGPAGPILHRHTPGPAPVAARTVPGDPATTASARSDQAPEDR